MHIILHSVNVGEIPEKEIPLSTLFTNTDISFGAFPKLLFTIAALRQNLELLEHYDYM